MNEFVRINIMERPDEIVSNRFSDMMKFVEVAETALCRAVALAYSFQGSGKLLPVVIEMQQQVHSGWQKLSLDTKVSELQLDDSAKRAVARNVRESFEPVFGTPAQPPLPDSYEEYVEQCKTDGRAVRYSAEQWVEMRMQAAEG